MAISEQGTVQPVHETAHEKNARAHEALQVKLGRLPTQIEFAEARGVSRQRVHQLKTKLDFATGVGNRRGRATRERIDDAILKLQAEGKLVSVRRAAEAVGMPAATVRDYMRGMTKERYPDARERLTGIHKAMTAELGRNPTQSEFVRKAYGEGANFGLVQTARRMGLKFSDGRKMKGK